MNVVSTSPSATEILYALGVEPAAVSHACDYPPEVAGTPRIDASRIGDGSSMGRHEQVREATSSGHVYDIDAERLRRVEPDLIVTQEVCGVCAVDEPAIDAVLDDLDVDPDVVALEASRLDDLFACIRTVGDATGSGERAGELVDSLRDRLAKIDDRTARAARRPRVTIIEWMDPIHVAANWVPELVDIAGGTYGMADPGQRSIETRWADVVAYDPEVIVIAPCSYSIQQTRSRIDELRDRDGWRSLPAVGQGQVYALDGSSYLSRWTPRLVDAAERMASILHPMLCDEQFDDVVRLPSTSDNDSVRSVPAFADPGVGDDR